MARPLSCALALLIAGCGDDDAAPSDGGTVADRGEPDGGLAIATPAEPAPPDFGACPTGWRAVETESGIAWCDPWPVGGPVDCEGAEAHFPGGDGCTRVGAACPAGEFPEATSLPADAPVLYVRPGAVGGDGTEGAPYGTITEAERRAPTGGVIALAKGTHDGIVSLERELMLVGACAAETMLTLTGSLGDSVVTVHDAPVVLRDLSIGETDRSGITAFGSRADVRVEGVVIRNVAGWGIGAQEGARVSGSDVVVRDVGDAPLRPGTGLASGDGGALTLTRLVIERASTTGGAAYRAGSVVVEDAAIRGTVGASDGFAGGALVANEATVEARRVAMRDNRDHGALVVGTGSRGLLELVVIEETRASAAAPDFGGRGILVDGAADVEARRAYVAGYSESAITVAETPMLLEDVIVREGRGTDDMGMFGYGLQVARSGAVRGARLAIDRAASAGVTVEPTGSLTMTDVSVRDTQPEPMRQIAGLGIHFGPESTGELTRVRVERSRSVGFAVVGPSTTVRVDDLLVRDTESAVVYFDTLGFPLAGILGRGITIDAGGELTVLRGLVENSREAAVIAQQTSVARFDDFAIRGARVRACAATDCADEPGGTALVVAHDATAELSRFEIRDSDLCGIQIVHRANVDLHHGVIAEHPVGACVQIDGYDLSRLMDGVIYRDNETSLAVTMLPVPDIAL